MAGKRRTIEMKGCEYLNSRVLVDDAARRLKTSRQMEISGLMFCIY
jgi:hypothetical protein